MLRIGVVDKLAFALIGWRSLIAWLLHHYIVATQQCTRCHIEINAWYMRIGAQRVDRFSLGVGYR